VCVWFVGSRGCLHASHFCYLLAQLEFGTHCQQPPAKLVLLGAPHTMLPLEKFATCEAIQCTEVYEYACRLANPNFYLPHFQVSVEPFVLLYTMEPNNLFLHYPQSKIYLI
jgi:hypothetical protein